MLERKNSLATKDYFDLVNKLEGELYDLKERIESERVILMNIDRMDKVLFVLNYLEENNAKLFEEILIKYLDYLKNFFHTVLNKNVDIGIDDLRNIWDAKARQIDINKINDRIFEYLAMPYYDFGSLKINPLENNKLLNELNTMLRVFLLNLELNLANYIRLDDITQIYYLIEMAYGNEGIINRQQSLNYELPEGIRADAKDIEKHVKAILNLLPPNLIEFYFTQENETGYEILDRIFVDWKGLSSSDTGENDKKIQALSNTFFQKYDAPQKVKAFIFALIEGWSANLTPQEINNKNFLLKTFTRLLNVDNFVNKLKKSLGDDFEDEILNLIVEDRLMDDITFGRLFYELLYPLSRINLISTNLIVRYYQRVKDFVEENPESEKDVLRNFYYLLDSYYGDLSEFWDATNRAGEKSTVGEFVYYDLKCKFIDSFYLDKGTWKYDPGMPPYEEVQKRFLERMMFKKDINFISSFFRSIINKCSGNLKIFEDFLEGLFSSRVGSYQHLFFYYIKPVLLAKIDDGSRNHYLLEKTLLDKFGSTERMRVLNLIKILLTTKEFLSMNRDFGGVTSNNEVYQILTDLGLS